MKKTRQVIESGLLALMVALVAPGTARAAGPGNLKFDESSFEVQEGAGMAVIVVERSQGEDGAVSVDYATSDGTATAGADYTAVAGTLTWGDGDEASKSFIVPILDDGIAEGAETVHLTLSNPTGGAAIDPDRGTSVVVILANDGGGGDDPPGDDPPGDDRGDGKAGAFKFDQRDFAVVEGASVAVISVERSHGETGAASVDYSTEPGTATPGADYTPVSGTLAWADGDESTKVFEVPIVADDVEERRETVKLFLSNPTGGAGVERAMAVLSILDDDDGQGNPGDDRGRFGTFKFAERRFQVFEGRPQAVIAVERSRGEAGVVSVDYATEDGSATGGLDYTGVSGTLFWGPGDSGVKTFAVPILDDDLVEGNETVDLILSNPTGGADLHPTRATSGLAILDDDGSTAACTQSPTVLCLLQGRFRLEVVWRSPQGAVGPGRVERVSDSSGLVWFFSPDNVEMLVKMIDACGAFSRYWVFFAATTNVDFTLTVTDTATGLVKEYSNALGQAAEPVLDTFTFDTCP